MKGEFGSVNDYFRAFRAVISKGIAKKHLALLRKHYQAPGHISTATKLAKAVRYPSYRTINTQYGTLAHRVARELGIEEPPRGFWLYVLVDWAGEVDPHGHTRFVLRDEVVETLQILGYKWATSAVPGPRSRKANGESTEAHRISNAALKTANRLVRWVKSDMDGLGHGVQFLHDELPGVAAGFLEGYGPPQRKGSRITARILGKRPSTISPNRWSEIINATREAVLLFLSSESHRNALFCHGPVGVVFNC
jgi:hypothetical protein